LPAVQADDMTSEWVPGEASAEVARAAARHLSPGSQEWTTFLPLERFPQFFERSRGAWLWDPDGRRYVDCYGGGGAVILGHGNEAQLEAMAPYLSSGASVSFRHPIEITIARWLSERLPFVDRVLFFKTGSEAVHAALAIALGGTRRRTIMSLGYHGWLPPFPTSWLTTPAITVREPDWDLEAVRHVIADCEDDLAALVVSPEPSVPDPDFYRALQAEARRVGARLIMDEVKSGFRYAFPCVSAAAGLDPDLIVLSKAIANGFPIAVVGAGAGLIEDADSFPVFSTFAGEIVSLAAAHACLNELANGAYARFERAAATIAAALADVFEATSVRLVGRPAAMRLAFPSSEVGTEFARRLAAAGVICHPRDVFNVTAAHDDDSIVTEVVTAFEAVTRQMHHLLR
jgi:glutamate-1-semialdehyde aminotransferase